MDAKTNTDTAADLHPWVVSTQACLERSKPGNDGLIRPDKIKRLNVCVGPQSVQRAMHIWDGIIKAIEASNFKIRMEKEAQCQTIATVDGEELSISLKEKTIRKEHVPTPAEKIEMKRYKYLHSVPKWDYLPSGQLVLAIDHMRNNELKWTDGDRKRIEDRMAAFAEVLLDVANDIKARRAKAEEWERNWAEEQRCKQQAARLQAEETRRVEQLIRQASSWQVACSIRQFVDAVREEAVRRYGGIEPRSSLDQWIQWAEQHAASTDPVIYLLANLTSNATGGSP